MNTLLPFLLAAVLILGIGPWFIIPALTGQSLGFVSATGLKWCQLFFFAPLCFVLVCLSIAKGAMK